MHIILCFAHRCNSEQCNVATGTEAFRKEDFLRINLTIKLRRTHKGLQKLLGGEIKADQMIIGLTEIEALYKVHMTEMAQEETLKKGERLITRTDQGPEMACREWTLAVFVPTGIMTV